MKSKANSVATVRKIRDRLSRKIKDMSFEEQKEFLRRTKGTERKTVAVRKAHSG